METININTLGLTYIFVDDSLLRMKSVQVPSFVCIVTMVIELRQLEDEEDNMDKMVIFGIQITFDIFCAVKSLKA